MRKERADRPARPTAPPPGQPAEPMTPEKPAAPATAPSGSGNDGPRALAPPPPNLRSGQPAADFALEKLDGRPIGLSSFKGKPLVLLFGNYSSPGFRDRADDYEQLRKQFANRAEFLIVYTRESHPVGEWEVERNKHAHVLVEQPKTFEERKALARQAKQALRLTIPIAIDTMDDKTAKEYGGFTTSAVVIGRDGTIAGFRTFADAHAVKRILESAIAGKPTTSPSSS
jgi:peroxiredoxin